MNKNNFNQREFVTIMNKDINRLENCNPNSTGECTHISDILTKVKELKKLKSININLPKTNKELFAQIRSNSISLSKNNKSLQNKFNKIKHKYVLDSEILLYIDVENEKQNNITPTTKRTIRDINNINVYPEELRSIYLDFNRNKKFRDCVDDVLNLDDDELFEILEENNLDKIVELLRRISELGPHDYMRCMDHLGDYCGSDVIHNYMQVITLIFNYFGSTIDINSKKPIKADNDFMEQTLPYVKKIYGKIIENARTINDYKMKRGECDSGDNKIIDRYKNIYDNLFDFKSCDVSYKLFDNYKLPGIDRITQYATNHTIIFVIILIFISFIFSKFVSMMSVQPLPVNKNIVQ